MFELESVFIGIELKERSSWEQARAIAYTTAQSQSTKKLKPDDIMKFRWDNSTAISSDKSVTIKDKERLARKAESMIAILNGEK
ncbi:MAG: hypothetical protein ACRCZM_08080 [Bacteroidales bacterium]